jgi:hypothetical protein
MWRRIIIHAERKKIKNKKIKEELLSNIHSIFISKPWVNSIWKEIIGLKEVVSMQYWCA